MIGPLRDSREKQLEKDLSRSSHRLIVRSPITNFCLSCILTSQQYRDGAGEHWLVELLFTSSIGDVEVHVVRQKLARLWHHFTTAKRRLREEDLLAIPHPKENIQRTFVGVLSSETADKLKAMFRKNYCPEMVPLTWGHELAPECQLVICCLLKNIRRMYLDDDTVFAKLITDAGLSQAMVLIIIFGEKKTPEETLYDENIYDSVLQQGQDLYKKGCMRSQCTLSRVQVRGDWSENIALVTVDKCPSTYQLEFMKKFVQNAFNDTRCKVNLSVTQTDF